MRLLHCSLAVFLLVVVAIVEAKDYDTRREELIVSALSTPDTNPTGIAPIQAYVVGETVPQSSIDALLENITTDPKADFRIVQLLRIMLLDPSYTSQILPTLSSPSLKYWLTPDDDVRVYWSENHHSMWMSSAWLLQEQFGVDVQDVTLKTRLTSFLQVKIQYGFYEFGSTLYLPYTLTGLLNLVDFCQDATIQDLAAQAALRLLQDILLLVNSEGVLFPAAGRNIVRMYLIPYDSNYNSIVWLLTGLGVQPKTVYHVGAFLLSSALDVSSLQWTPRTNKVLNIGHDLDSTDTIYKDLTRVDRTLAQWSFGGYFHPGTIDDTRALLDSYDLQDHEEFEQFQALTSLPSGIANLGILEQITKSTVIVEEQIRVFRGGPVTLSSAQDFWPGHLGYQQWPWMAAIGRLAVWTQSGVSGPPDQWTGTTTNSHLPYVKQQDNVALIMYNPDPTYQLAVGMAGIDNFDVTLRWPSSEWNAQDRVGEWFLGRQWGGFIAVRSHCGSTVCGDDKQTWAVVVGNPDMYGDFSQFKAAIQRSTYKQERRGRWFQRSSYYGMIEVDTPSGPVKIEHSW